MWEANHVWLIFILVVMWTAFPEAFGSITSTLAVPLFLAAVGIILRGTAFALRGEAASMFEQRCARGIFALSSLLVPFFLGTVVGGIASGRVPVGNAAGDELTSWANETIDHGRRAVDRDRRPRWPPCSSGPTPAGRGRTELVAALRVRALGSGLVAGAVALVGLLVVRSDAPDLYDGLTSGAGLAVRAGVGRGRAGDAGARMARALRGRPLQRGRLRWRRSWPGWRRRRSPTCCRPSSRSSEAAAPDATLAALLGGAAIGLCILIPALTWLFRLTLRGDLDKGSNV